MPAAAGRKGVGSRLLVLILLAGGSVPLASPAGAAPATFRSYVALGDSFTAGPLIPVTDSGSMGCVRSLANYPQILRARYQVEFFSDRSCSGAAVRNMFEPQQVRGGSNPAQLDALAPDTQLVSLQIGGNDIGYAELAFHCTTLLPLGAPCQARYVQNGVDIISGRIAALRPAVESLLAEIRRRSPGAHVFVLGYQSLLPENSPGCWPAMPYAPLDVPYLVAKQIELNAMLHGAAAAQGAVYVDTYTPSLGHDACAPMGVRWAEPILAPLGGGPVHPNGAGMQAMANQVTGAINGSIP